jgi:hypothetical protein
MVEMIHMGTVIFAFLAGVAGWAIEIMQRRGRRKVSWLGITLGAVGIGLLTIMASSAAIPREPSRVRTSLAEISSADVSRAELGSAELREPMDVPLAYPEDPVQQAAFEAKYRVVYRMIGPPPSPSAQPVMGYWRLPRGYGGAE